MEGSTSSVKGRCTPHCSVDETPRCRKPLRILSWQTDNMINTPHLSSQIKNLSVHSPDGCHSQADTPPVSNLQAFDSFSSKSPASSSSLDSWASLQDDAYFPSRRLISSPSGLEFLRVDDECLSCPADMGARWPRRSVSGASERSCGSMENLSQEDTRDGFNGFMPLFARCMSGPDASVPSSPERKKVRAHSPARSFSRSYSNPEWPQQKCFARRTPDTVAVSLAPDDAMIQDVVASLECRGVRAVVFDYDCTITQKHSGGRVRKERMAQFLRGNMSPFFQRLLPVLLERSFFVGVATFADGLRVPSTHVAGENLVREHFAHIFDDTFEDRIPVIAAFPDNYSTEAAYHSMGLTAPMAPHKEYHLQQLCQMWSLSARQVALVDDDQKNVKAAIQDGHPAMFVRNQRGVRIEDMMTSYPELG